MDSLKFVGCPKLPDGIFIFEEELSYSIFLQGKNTSQPVYIYAEQMEKSSKGYALVRNLANINASSYVIWKSSKTGTIGSTKKSYDRKIIELTPDLYDVFIDDVKVRTVDLRYGGVYNLLVGIDSDSNEIISKLVEIIVPNSMNMLWLIPQFFIMTLGEVIFSVTGLEFSYSQAPISMKSVMHSCWLLTVAFGNVIIVVEAELHLFQSEAYEFFFFAALMFVDVIVFMWLAYRYKPHNPMLSESREYFIFEEPKTANENELKGHHIS